MNNLLFIISCNIDYVNCTIISCNIDYVNCTSKSGCIGVEIHSCQDIHMTLLLSPFAFQAYNSTIQCLVIKWEELPALIDLIPPF